MKKKIAVFGSTGSIGKTTIDIIKKDKKNFEVILLTSNNNYQELAKQARLLNAKNLIIKNKKQYLNLKKTLQLKFLMLIQLEKTHYPHPPFLINIAIDKLQKTLVYLNLKN